MSDSSHIAEFDVRVVPYGYRFKAVASPMYTINHDRTTVFKVRVDEFAVDQIDVGVVKFGKFQLDLDCMWSGETRRIRDDNDNPLLDMNLVSLR